MLGRQASKGRIRMSRIAIIIIAVLVLTNGVAAWLLFSNDNPLAGGVSDVVTTENEAATRLYLTLEPEFIVNFQGTRTLRYLQSTISLMSYEQTALEAIKRHMPAVRDRVLLTLSEQKLETMLTREAKLALREKILADLRELLTEVGDDNKLEALYFVSFVMQ